TASHVVPGICETITRYSPGSLLINEDLPTFGRPMMATLISLRPRSATSTAAAVRSSSRAGRQRLRRVRWRSEARRLNRSGETRLRNRRTAISRAINQLERLQLPEAADSEKGYELKARRMWLPPSGQATASEA